MTTKLLSVWSHVTVGCLTGLGAGAKPHRIRELLSGLVCLAAACVPDAELSPSCELDANGSEEVLYGFDTSLQGFAPEVSREGGSDWSNVTEFATVDWVSAPSANGAPGAMRIVAPFSDYKQSVVTEVALEPPADYRARRLRACVRLEAGFSPDAKAPGEAFLYVKTVPGQYAWGQSPVARILPSAFGAWLPIELDLDNPEAPAAQYSAAEVIAMGVRITTGNGSTGTTESRRVDPTATIAYVDQVTLIAP